MSKAIILLSGGLDSLVSLGLNKDIVKLALTFDYGQKSAQKEIAASKKICEYYNIQHEIIKLDWLKNITDTALVKGDIPKGIQKTSNAVWVPNRNGLFLNIAASFADAKGYDVIIIGANKEEAQTFPDNTEEFIKRVNLEFEYSTKVRPKVLAPLINLDKNDIVKQAIEHSIPLELVQSCYREDEGHCGTCESCVRLKNALIANGRKDYENIIFNRKN